MKRKHDTPDEILGDWLFLGSFDASENAEALQKAGITHVFSTVGAPDNVFDGIEYTYMDLLDVPRQDLTEAITFVVPYLNNIRDSGGKVFIHCVAGISRSSSMIIAYLMLEYGMNYDEALAFVQAKRPIVYPNSGFEKQLRALTTV